MIHLTEVNFLKGSCLLAELSWGLVWIVIRIELFNFFNFCSFKFFCWKHENDIGLLYFTTHNFQYMTMRFLAKTEMTLIWLYLTWLWLADKISCQVCPITIQLNRPKAHVFSISQLTMLNYLLVMADKLSVKKCKHSYWSTGHSTHLWLDDKSQMNLWRTLSACPWTAILFCPIVNNYLVQSVSITT